MAVRADLRLFAHLTSRPEAELDLGQAALLVAETERPDIDLPRYVERLDRFGAEARARAAGKEGRAALEAVVRLVYGELGFHGNHDDYYDPSNSYLDEVLDRRTGIPITLGIVLVEVCRRAEIGA